MIQFSFVIPTFNRPQPLERCLAALARLEFPRDQFEVLIVDDGSDPPAAAVARQFEPQLALALVRQANTGPAAARNAAAVSARGAWLAFIDDDCEPRPDWLTTLARHAARQPADMIGGRTINARPHDPYATLSQLVVDVAYSHYNRDEPVFFASNNMALPVSGFREVGGFDATFRAAEDRDLCDRWRRSGRRMTYAPDLVLEHAHVLTLRDLWRQHFGYGRGAYRFHRKRALAGAGRLRPDPAFYRRLARSAFLTPWHLGLRIEMLLAVQQAANAAGFVAEALGRRARSSLISPSDTSGTLVA